MDLSTSAVVPAKITVELAAAAGATITAAAMLATALELTAPFIAFTTLLGLALATAVGICWATTLPDQRPGATNSFGLANRITLGRGVLICVIAGFLPFPDYAQAHTWAVAAITLLALTLDGIDGATARRTRSQSAFGARFDMELDALLMLILCGLLVTLDKVGPWVLLIGLYRYLFVAAGRVYPVLKRPLPDSFRRKTVCVWQLVTLVACLLPFIPPKVANIFLALALVLLTYSFIKDSIWLLSQAKK